METDLEGGLEWVQDGVKGGNGIGVRAAVGLGSKMLLKLEMAVYVVEVSSRGGFGNGYGLEFRAAMDYSWR